MMSPPRMRHHFLLSTTTMLILVMNAGRNANGQDQPEVQTDDNTYGLGEHKLTTTKKGGKTTTTVTLAYESRKATAKDVKKYEGSGIGKFKGCKVTKTKDDNFFIVHYDEKAAEHGCAVDFIISKDAKNKNVTNQIKFTASVKDKGECLDCGTGINEERWASNENIVPFIFSEKNAIVEQLIREGPLYWDNKCDKEKSGCEVSSSKQQCISFTALEIRWAKTKCKKNNKNNAVKAYLHQVGEPIMNGRDVNVNQKDGTNEIQIIGTALANGLGVSFEPSITQPMCINNRKSEEGIPVPKAWPIDNKDFNGSYLFVFQLLPQSATLKFDNDGKMTMDKPEGTPKCVKNGLFIKFSTDVYSNILMPPTTMPTTTTTTTTTTTAATTTTTAMIVPSTMMNKPPVANENSTKSSQVVQPAAGPDPVKVEMEMSSDTPRLTTTIMTETKNDPPSNEKTEQEEEAEKESSKEEVNDSDVITIGVIATVTLLTIILITIVIIICICRRKKKTKARKTIEIGFFGTHGATLLRRRAEDEEFYLTRQTLSNDAQKGGGGNGTREGRITIWEWNDNKEDDEAIYKDMDLHPEDYWEDVPIPIDDVAYYDDEMEDQFSEDG